MNLDKGNSIIKYYYKNYCISCFTYTYYLIKGKKKNKILLFKASLFMEALFISLLDTDS